MAMDLELYRIFCEVVKYKNISRTAENLYVSQSAVTQSIQKLEHYLGGKVFYRNKTGVELTEEGRNLYEYIKNSYETLNNAENIYSQYNNLEKGKIRIGGGNSIIQRLILQPLVEFIKKYPNIDISINSGLTDNLMQSLSNGELDMVVLNLPYLTKSYSNITILNLKKSSFCFYASKQYLKEHKVKDDWSNVKENTFIFPKYLSSKRRQLDNYCKKEGIEIEPAYQISSSTITKKLVLDNVGIGFTNIENLNDIIDDIEIIKKVEFDDIYEGIAVMNKNMANKACSELVKRIKKYHNFE